MVREVTFTCDHDGCANTTTVLIECVDADAVFQRAARKQAYDAGWAFSKGTDLCPTHRLPPLEVRYADCPREGCGRNVAVNKDGSLRRHRRLVDGELGPSCRDPISGDVHTRYPNQVSDKPLEGNPDA
ncbi:hypothetical protein [Lentzea cavernae]|uniref:hypothetical protein n=1 Tax=Lentzea cavernae TaxID=2020703 RepID=UPI001749C6BD|nr:hypothetical protein [Lentzea cavernae]